GKFDCWIIFGNQIFFKKKKKIKRKKGQEKKKIKVWEGKSRMAGGCRGVKSFLLTAIKSRFMSIIR
ncbi:hypothetical protein ONO57_04645, partial [Salmonella enterica subsp. enterica serovar Anatum]|nr:hypothetical protein [Salmonella enterica subsp. enterica serovar Anatum]